jgi:hypothetical protein
MKELRPLLNDSRFILVHKSFHHPLALVYQIDLIFFPLLAYVRDGRRSPMICSLKKSTTASPPFVAFNPGGIAIVLMSGIIVFASLRTSFCWVLVHWLEQIYK